MSYLLANSANEYLLSDSSYEYDEETQEPQDPEIPLPEVTATTIAPKTFTSLLSESDAVGHYVNNGQEFSKMWIGANLSVLSSYTPRIFTNYLLHWANDQTWTDAIPNAEGYYDCTVPGTSVHYHCHSNGEIDKAGGYVVHYKERNGNEIDFGIYGAEQISSEYGRAESSIPPGTYGIASLVQSSGDLIECAYIPKEYEQNWLNGEIFIPEYVEESSKFYMPRFMDWNDTNHTRASLPEHFQRKNMRDFGTVAPVELHEKYCQATGATRIWFNIPPRTTVAAAEYLANELKTRLPGVTIDMEFGNELWNTAAAFQDSSHWVKFYDVEAKILTHLGDGVFEAPAGMVVEEGDDLKGFESWEHALEGDWNEFWRTFKAVNVSGQTLQLAHRDTMVPFTDGFPSDFIGITVKQTKLGSLPNAAAGQAMMANELYPIFKEALGDNLNLIIGSQHVNAWQTSQSAAAFDIASWVATAPYWGYNQENYDTMAGDFAGMTKATVDRYKNGLPRYFSEHVNEFGKYGHRIYEFNSHFTGKTFTDEEWQKLTDWLADEEQLIVFDQNLRIAAACGYEGGCIFSDYRQLQQSDGSYGSEFGLRSYPGEPSYKAQAVEKFTTTGGVPRGGVDFNRESHGNGIYSVKPVEMIDYGPFSIIAADEYKEVNGEAEPIVFRGFTPSGQQADLNMSPTGIPWFSKTDEVGEFTIQTLNADDTWTTHPYTVIDDVEAGSGISVSSVTPGLVRPGNSIQFTYSNSAGAVSVATSAGGLLTVSNIGGVITVECPELSAHGNRTLDYGDVTFTVSDASSSASVSIEIAPPADWYYGEITSIHAQGAYANDASVITGQSSLAYLESGTGDFYPESGLATTDPSDPAVFRYKVYDGSWPATFTQTGYGEGGEEPTDPADPDDPDETGDTTAPVPVFSGPTGQQYGPFDVSLSFGEEVPGFGLSMITHTNSTLDNHTYSGNGNYTFTATPVADSSGIIELNVPAGVVQDNAGNDNVASSTYSVSFNTDEAGGPDPDPSPEIVRIGSNNQVSRGATVAVAVNDIDLNTISQAVLSNGLTEYEVSRSGSNITIPDHVPAGTYTLKLRKVA